ncbi:PspC domain-containing protein [Brevibacillus centrosporus]|uniref:PspC domain-containing protein n=1 Tax=Brevibacillus centrosporus TaxID=54910 RepID=UPI003B018702
MRKLTKSSNDKALYGVCGGIADFFGISPSVVRLIFFLTSSVSVWIYLVLVWTLDEKPTLLK